MDGKERLEQVLPGEIEKRSFAIISQELGERTFDPLEEPVIKRCSTQVRTLTMRIIWSFPPA